MVCQCNNDNCPDDFSNKELEIRASIFFMNHLLIAFEYRKFGLSGLGRDQSKKYLKCCDNRISNSAKFSTRVP